MGRARDIANVLSSSTNIALDSELGLSLITPTSIAATGGSGSISTTGTVSFTSASAISLNDVFSASYDNYYLTGNISVSTSADILLRWRVGGADNTTSNYSYGLYRKDFGGVTFTGDTQSTGNTLTFGVVNAGTTPTGFWKNINNPFANQRTTFIGQNISTAGSGYAYYDSHMFNTTTSFTGLTFYGSSGTITGTISVYGYRK